MVYRYGLVLAGGQEAGPEQVDTMIGAAVMSAERYYPALQLLVWGDRTPERRTASRHCRGLRARVTLTPEQKKRVGGFHGKEPDSGQGSCAFGVRQNGVCHVGGLAGDVVCRRVGLGPRSVPF